MSGIGGILHFDGRPIERERLERMLKAMERRGPHARDLHTEDGLGLVCAHLNLSPRPDGRADSSSPSLRLPLAFDGRLDNRADLIARLKPASPSVSDAELVFAAYQRWSEDCPQYLLGDFAFALWDREKKKLFCARDHFGVKPFFYHHSDVFFIFASSPYAILAAHRELCEINDARVADFLVGFEGYDEVVTFYKRIFRLPRRQSMTVDGRGMRAAQYWDLQPSQKEYRSEGEYIEAFLEIFSEAVKCRLGTPGNTFVPLSGGLDSTSIAAISREIFARDGASLPTLSAVSADENDSETERIRSVLAQGKMNGKLLSADYILEDVDNLLADLARLDDPFDTFENSWRPLYRQAREDGIHISLDGIDSDLMLAESNSLAILWRSGRYRDFLGETLFAGGLTKFYYKHPLIWFLTSLRSVLAPEWLKALRRDLSNRTAISRLNKKSLISSDLAYRVRLRERHKLFSSYDVRPASASLIESHKQSIFHPHLQAGLERYDRLAAAYSIESRHPFLDPRLAEFCLALPWQFRTHRGWTKILLRKAMESCLPEQVVWGREKKHPAWGFSLRILTAKKESFWGILKEEEKALKDYADINKLNKVWNRFFSRGGDDEAFQIWETIGLAFWLRRQREFVTS
jgi:asparagine synthase (glutamine-hydrolysing)